MSPKTPVVLPEARVEAERQRLFHGLATGDFHAHLQVLGRNGLRWTLIPHRGRYGALCGTRRCIWAKGAAPSKPATAEDYERQLRWIDDLMFDGNAPRLNDWLARQRTVVLEAARAASPSFGIDGYA